MAYKRPYPGEWGPGPTGENKMSRGGYFGGSYYTGMQWGPGQSAAYSGYNYSAPPPPAPPTGAKPDSKVDFTDDYSVFYGNTQGNNFFSYGAQRGSSQFRGQGWGRGYANQGGNQAPNQGRGGQNGRGMGQPGRGARGGRGKFRGWGMPGNNFGARGRGRGKTGSVPPVHTLAKSKPAVPDISQMSVAEKLHRFCLFLKNEDTTKVNAVQTIVNAITSSKLGLKVDFDTTELTWVSNQKVYTGAVKIEKVFLARSVGFNKKGLKQSVYEKALNVLLTHTVADIFHLVDPGPEAVREKLLADKKKVEQSEEDEDMETVSATDINSIFNCFKQRLKTLEAEKTRDDAISFIEQVLNQIPIVKKHEYTCETIKRGNTFYYTGKFEFCDVVLGRGQGTSKKVCKRLAYQQVMERISSLSIEELIVTIPEETIPEYKKGHISVKAAVKDLSLEDRFKDMMNALSGMNFSGNSINPVDVTAMQYALFPMLIYKPAMSKESDHSIICDLYIEKIYIASGEALKKKESMVNAYTAAWDLLTTASADLILKEHRRITDDEMRSPQIMDIILKGTGRSMESNLAGLKRFGYKTSELPKKLEDMVIVEHKDWSQDRAKNAFCILQFSCSQNGIFMQWETETATSPSIFKCVMSLQGKVMGESYGYSKTHARNFAATDALFKLYETQDVVKIAYRQDEDKWILYEDIKKAAEVLRAENKNDEPTPTKDEKGNELPDPYVAKVIDGKVQAFLSRNKEEVSELIFGPGLSEPEWRDLRHKAKASMLKYECRQHQGKVYFLIYEKFDWDVLARILKKREENIFGKYELVSSSQKPKHEDIEKNIMRVPPEPRTVVRKHAKNNGKAEVKDESIKEEGVDEAEASMDATEN